MKTWLLVLLAVVAGGSASPARAQVPTTPPAATPSFADFDRRARAGERLNVVFFGCSLTWGANTTDQSWTSYRARMSAMLEARYPQAHFSFRDSAIGGTNSVVGIFRFERDVLRHRPDLVFLDFSANDDIYNPSLDSLAAFEAIIRRTIVEAHCPAVIVIFPFKWNVTAGNTGGMKGREADLALAKAYGIPAGDAIVYCQEQVKAGKVTAEQIWDWDPVHPGDLGYQLFAEAAWQGFTAGVEGKMVGAAPPQMLHGETFMHSARVRLSTLGRLPAGWQVGMPNRTAAWHDGLMSRWLDDVTIAAVREVESQGPDGKPVKTPVPVQPLTVKFSGSIVFLWGEGTPKSCSYRAYIDEQLVTRREGQPPQVVSEFSASTKKFGGNIQHAQVIATGLDPDKEHTLRIEPLLGPEATELRLESICVAGGQRPRVWLGQ